MKKYLIATLVAGIIVAALPAGAQETKKTKEEDKDKQVQTITITRKADKDEKTVIEIKGDKVTVNGKEAGKDSDVKVRVNTITRPKATVYSKTAQGRANTWAMADHDQHVSLFTEDSNRAMLGVVTDMNDKGARITSVNKESAAEKAGLKKGDIITSIGDKKIEDAEDVSKAVHSHKPGDKVTVKILRDGKQETVTAELGRWKGIQFNKLIPSRIYGEDLNVTVPPDAYNFNIAPTQMEGFRGFFDNRPKLGVSIQDTEDGKGVKVTEVDEDGNAAKAGVKKDDIITHINDKEVNSADEIARLVRENKEKLSMRFKVNRNGKTENLEVKMPRTLKTAEL